MINLFLTYYKLSNHFTSWYINNTLFKCKTFVPGVTFGWYCRYLSWESLSPWELGITFWEPAKSWLWCLSSAGQAFMLLFSSANNWDRNSESLWVGGRSHSRFDSFRGYSVLGFVEIVQKPIRCFPLRLAQMKFSLLINWAERSQETDISYVKSRGGNNFYYLKIWQFQNQFL